MSDPTIDGAFPTLTDEQLLRLRSFGDEVSVPLGEFIFVEDQAEYDFVVIVSGAVAIVRRNVDLSSEVLIARHITGRFVGELSLLTGERTTLAARSDAADTRVIRITPARFRDVMATEPDLADIIFTALVARREILRTGEGAGAIRIIGSRFSARAVELESFARRQHLVHRWIDLDGPDVDDIEVLLASVGVTPADTPVVITSTAVLRHPTVAEFAARVGISFRPAVGRVRDLVVIGAGPGGLAAGVYGASEGLDTLVLDANGVGGQAAANSRSSDEVTTRAVILATGVHYRRLAVADLERFENAGVFYAATDLEARVCGGSHVVVIGGGNSAGQAAIFLAQRGSDLTIVLRGDNLVDTMSTYLIDRITANHRITISAHTEVTALHGQRSLVSVDLTTTSSAGATTKTVPTTGVFCFIGATADTAWLSGLIALDDDGFVLTDHDLPETAYVALPFETSQPGIFAIGDVRHGSMKRVAAAVGEGSSAVRSVHQRFA